MDNLKALAKMGTQDTGRKKKTTLNITGKMKKMSNEDPHEIRGNSRCSRSASISCFISDPCHVTHIVKFGISVAGDRGKVKLDNKTIHFLPKE